MLFRLVRWTHIKGPAGQIAVGGNVAALTGPAYLAYSLERLAVLVPCATYDLDLTLSGRAISGALWSPFDHVLTTPEYARYAHFLPEILHVDGHTGIRVHALNEAEQSDGCVGVGHRQYDADTIFEARPALEALCKLLATEKTGGRASQLEIVEAFA